MGEHGFYCDGSLKALAEPTAWAEMLSCKLLSTAAVFVLYMMWWKSSMQSHARTLFRTLWYGVLNTIARQLDFFYIFLFKNKCKALNTLFDSTEFPIKRGRVFLFLCLKICLDIATRWTQWNHHKQSCSDRETPPFFSSTLFLLYGCTLYSSFV